MDPRCGPNARIYPLGRNGARVFTLRFVLFPFLCSSLHACFTVSRRDFSLLPTEPASPDERGERVARSGKEQSRSESASEPSLPTGPQRRENQDSPADRQRRENVRITNTREYLIDIERGTFSLVAA